MIEERIAAIIETRIWVVARLSKANESKPPVELTPFRFAIKRAPLANSGTTAATRMMNLSSMPARQGTSESIEWVSWWKSGLKTVPSVCD